MSKVVKTSTESGELKGAESPGVCKKCGAPLSYDYTCKLGENLGVNFSAKCSRCDSWYRENYVLHYESSEELIQEETLLVQPETRCCVACQACLPLVFSDKGEACAGCGALLRDTAEMNVIQDVGQGKCPCCAGELDYGYGNFDRGPMSFEYSLEGEPQAFWRVVCRSCGKLFKESYTLTNRHTQQFN